MNRSTSTILAIAAATGAAFASCAVGATEAAPTMKFIATPATHVAAVGGAAVHRGVVTYQRTGDTMLVIVREAAPCGERPEAPSFGIEGQRLTIHYHVANPVAGDAACFSTAIASFHGLPGKEFEVLSQADANPNSGLALAR